MYVSLLVGYFLTEIRKLLGYLKFWMRYLFDFLDIPGMLVHKYQINMTFLCVCQSRNWLASLLKVDKYMDISSSGWDIFLIILEIFLGCWYTCYKWFWISCLSVSLFVCLLPSKIRQRYISRSGWDIFLEFFEDITGHWYTGSK